MAYVFTNTITTLPYGYYVKVEVIKAPGTGATTVTNGGYISDLGSITTAIDRVVGDFNPGDLSMTFINTGNVFSANVFTDSIDDIEIRVWVSYDAGTTYENVFCGFVDLETIGYSDRDATETRNREYPITAKSALARLNSVAVDFSTLPSGAFSTTRYPTYETDETGTPVEVTSGGRRRGGPTRSIDPDFWNIWVASKFVPIGDIFEHCISAIPFITGATAPTIALDVSDLEHRWYHDASGLDYQFDQMCLCAPQSLSASVFPGFFGVSGGPAGAYDAQNLRELLKRLCQSLFVVPVPRLWDNAGTLTYTIYLKHRISSTTASVAGTLPTPLTRAWEGAPWVQSIEVVSPGLPLTYRATGRFAGKTLQIRNLFHTVPKPAGLPATFLWRSYYADPGNGDRFSANEFAATSQMFVRTGVNTVVNVNKCKILASQSFFETSQIGYYGLAAALYDLAFDNASTNLYKGRKAGYTLDYPTLRGSDVWDLQPGKILDGANQVGGTDLVIESVTRSIGKNETQIKASKRTA